MDAQTIITISSIWINVLMIGLLIMSHNRATAIEELVAYSPTICLICRQDKHHQADHEYIHSHLVYIPDELLR